MSDGHFLTIQNNHDEDVVRLYNEHECIQIEREAGIVYITIDHGDDSETRLILGQAGETQRL